jgi:hypothetical protein
MSSLRILEQEGRELENQSKEIMNATADNEMLPEYKFDYSKSRPNRFAAMKKDRTVVLPDPDVATVFTTPEAVNKALRALIAATPAIPKKRTVR